MGVEGQKMRRTGARRLTKAQVSGMRGPRCEGHPCKLSYCTAWWSGSAPIELTCVHEVSWLRPTGSAQDCLGFGRGEAEGGTGSNEGHRRVAQEGCCQICIQRALQQERVVQHFRARLSAPQEAPPRGHPKSGARLQGR